MATIKYEDFKKLEMKVGTIINAENIEGADKLFKLTVDMGTEKRTFAAGLKEYYKKEELIGKQVIVLTNLEPKIIRGVESQGMLLAAVSGDQKVVSLLQPDRKMSNGDAIY